MQAAIAASEQIMRFIIRGRGRGQSGLLQALSQLGYKAHL